MLLCGYRDSMLSKFLQVLGPFIYLLVNIYILVILPQFINLLGKKNKKQNIQVIDGCVIQGIFAEQ